MAKREVDFYKYCRTCKYEENDENEKPCYECLKHPANINSRKPINYKEKKAK